MNLLNKLKRFYYKFKNSDPVKNCPVYLDKGCSHVDGPICPFPKECNLVKDHLDSKWTSCCECNFIDNCCSNQFGFGCHRGEKNENSR